MTREEARQAAAVMTAYADGKVVQIFKDGEWVDHDDPRFILGPENYRVKPEVFDPVCLIHGKKASEHNCLYCCLCFRSLTLPECHINSSGKPEDVCMECAKEEEWLRKIAEDASSWVCDCGQPCDPMSPDWRRSGSGWEHFHPHPAGHVAASRHPHEGNDLVLVCTSCGNVALAGTVFIKPFEAWPSGLPPLTQFKPAICQDCAANEAEANR